MISRIVVYARGETAGYGSDQVSIYNCVFCTTSKRQNTSNNQQNQPKEEIGFDKIKNINSPLKYMRYKKRNIGIRQWLLLTSITAKCKRYNSFFMTKTNQRYKRFDSKWTTDILHCNNKSSCHSMLKIINLRKRLMKGHD